MTEKHVIDLLAAYALGSLDEAESREVARHLAQCEACQADLRAYRSVVDRMPLAAPERTPPAHLRQSILDRAAPRPAVPAPAARPVEPSRSWWQRIFSGPAWAPAALLLIVILIAGNILLWARLQRSGQAQQQAVVAQIRLVEMKGTNQAPTADGVLVYQPSKDNTLLVVEGMPQLPAGQAYQLWLIQGDQRDSGGVFSVRPNGYGVLQVSPPKPLTHYTAFGVTIEPAGGSPGPTGAKVLGGSF